MGPRIDEVVPGHKSPDGAVVVATATTYADGPDDGITTLWWDDGSSMYSSSTHRMAPSGCTCVFVDTTCTLHHTSGPHEAEK